MPLAGFPSDDLYPSSDLYPGLADTLAVFETPTRDLAFPMEGNLYALLPHAMSVWRVDDVWAEGFAPGPDVEAAADRFYRGGYRHPITADQIVELTDAGYGDYITVLEVED